MSQVISANRLTDGIVVFYQGPSKWAEFIDQALVLTRPEDVEAALLHAAKDVKANVIVDPYAFDVTIQHERITPTHLREKIRAQGPTVHLDHGKQAQSHGMTSNV